MINTTYPIKKNYLLFIVSLLLSFFSLIFFNIQPGFEFRDLGTVLNTTHYAINYFEFGFVKRAFIGTLYYLLFTDISQAGLLCFQAFFIFLFTTVCFVFFKHYRLHNSYIYLLFIISPATILQFTYDVGRFDIVLATCFMLSLMAAKKSLILFCLISCTAILIHEIYIFFFLPASFIALIQARKKIESIKSLFIEILKSPAFHFLLVFIIIVIYYGRYEYEKEELLNLFSLQLSKSLASYATFVWSSSIPDNFEMTTNTWHSWKILHPIAMLGIFFLYFRLLGINFKNRTYFVIITTALPMFILGSDYLRWISLLFISIFLTLITLETEKVKTYSSIKPALVSFYGPLGFISGLTPPLLDKIIAIFTKVILV